VVGICIIGAGQLTEEIAFQMATLDNVMVVGNANYEETKEMKISNFHINYENQVEVIFKKIPNYRDLEFKNKRKHYEKNIK